MHIVLVPSLLAEPLWSSGGRGLHEAYLAVLEHLRLLFINEPDSAEELSFSEAGVKIAEVGMSTLRRSLQLQQLPKGKPFTMHGW